MKSKRILLLVFSCATVFSAVHSQTVKNDPDYRKFRISVDVGLDYTQGTSGTVLHLPFGGDFAMPSVSKDFTAGFDGAYFLTKQYGIGLKYRFFTANYNQSFLSDYVDIEKEYDFQIIVRTASLFKEQTHVFGPAVYARWFLGQSKWNVSANAGVVYLYDKLSGIEFIKRHYPKEYDSYLFVPNSLSLKNLMFSLVDYTGATVGFTLSSGIRYQLSPAIGIGVSANGLFASLSRMKYKDELSEEYKIADISRNINRIGISAGIDFYF